MDLLRKSYGFDESDTSEEAQESENLSKTIVRSTETVPNENETIDYLGLGADSDEDIIMPISKQNKGPLEISQPVDILINAYQLNETGFGPETQPSSSDLHLETYRNTKRFKRDVRHQNPYFLNNESDIISSVTDEKHKHNDTDNIFETESHFMTVKQSISSSLPKCVKYNLTDHRGCVNTLHWGQIPYSHLLLSSSMDGTVRIWNVLERAKCVWDTESRLRASCKDTRSAVRCARWDTTGRLVAFGGYDKSARVIDVEKGVEVFSGVHRNVVNCLQFHPIEPHAMVCGTDGRIECWDTRERCSKPIQDILFLNGGSEFLSCSNLVTRDSADRTVMAWDYRTGAVLSNQIYNERYHCTCLRVHPSNKWFVAQTNGNYVALFSASRPYRMNKKKRYDGHEVEGYWIGCDISPDGQFLYSGSANGCLYAYSFWKGSCLARIRITDVPCLAVETHPVLQSTVAVSDMKGVIHIWH